MRILIFSFLLSLSAQAMQFESFLKINDEYLFSAIKIYKRANKEVHLSATIHFGEKRYYQELNEYIKNQLVIYELQGCNHEQKQEWDKQIQALDPSYQELFKNIQRLQQPYELAAYSFGLSSQNDELNLSLAKALIHADFVASQHDLNIYKDSASIIHYLDDIHNEYKKRFDKDISELVREVALSLANMKNLINALFLNHKKNDLNFKLRNNTVILAINRALYEHQKIHVIYGALHQDYFATFLEANGFELIETKWLPVFKIE